MQLWFTTIAILDENANEKCNHIIQQLMLFNDRWNFSCFLQLVMWFIGNWTPNESYSIWIVTTDYSCKYTCVNKVWKKNVMVGLKFFC